MELHEYSDEDLRNEIKRRAKEKAIKTRLENKQNRYTYWEGTIGKISQGLYKGIFGLYFSILEDKPNRCCDNFQLAQGFGFNKDNTPKVGDKVRLRYRNGKGINSGINNSKIVKIL